MFARIVEPDGSITMEMPGQNVKFQMPAIADVDIAGLSAKYFDDAADTLGALIEASAAVARDPDLTDVGKKKRLDPKQAAVVEMVANRWDAIDQQGADFTDARLAGATISNVNFTSARFQGADLSGATLQNDSRSAPAGSDGLGWGLAGADFTRSPISGRAANLSRAVLQNADLSGVDFVEADFSGAQMAGTLLRGANLTGARLAGAQPSGLLGGQDLGGTNLTGIDFSGQDLSQANLSNAILSASPLTTAMALVFHHPEIMNLKPDLGADILQRIESLPCTSGNTGCVPFVGTLAQRIALMNAQNGYPTTTPGGWATLVAQKLADGTPVVGADGQPIYRVDLSRAIGDYINAVVKEILKNVFDDPLFEGINWHATTGMASKSVAASGLTADGGFNVEAAQPVGSTVDGINMVDLQVADAASRRVRLTVRNYFLRFLSVYVQYQDDTGTALPIDNPGSLDTKISQYLMMVSSDSTLMGIPFLGNTAPSTDIEVTIPDGASAAEIRFGSLGMGGEAFTQEAVAGASLTLALNIGLPTICMALGIYLDAQRTTQSLLDQPSIIEGLGKRIVTGLAQDVPSLTDGIYSGGTSLSVFPFLIAAANIAIQELFANAPTLFTELYFAVGGATMYKAIPLVNIGCAVMAEAANALTIGQAVGESLACPAITTNRLSLKMDTTVRISRDPRDFQFPASATNYKVEAFYDGGTKPRHVQGTVTPGTPGPIDVVLKGVPSGGKVLIRVSFYSDANGTCLVGSKDVGPIVNLPATASLISVEIEESILALTQDTQYGHLAKLQYANDARVWNTTAAPPKLTRNNLCQGADNAICALNGLTVHTATGMAGYGFNAGGQNVGLCGGSTSGGSLNTIQNVFLGDDPDSKLKFSVCGSAQPIGIVYNPVNPAVNGEHFFVQPAEDGFHLRTVTLDGTPFNMSQSLSWGRFNSALDSLAVLPSGYVVGVNRQTHKMEILMLPRQPIDQASAPASVPFACLKAGYGTRAGLMDTPVAVASLGGAILVLEQGNKRIQAFDQSANPLKQFKNQTTALMPLNPEGGAVYLDLAVESMGYMYVLSYISDGSLPQHYRLDLYTPNGDYLARTIGVAAARLAVDRFRNVYTLNYEALVGSPRVEPSLSKWLPQLPNGVCPSTLPPSSKKG